MAMLDIEGKTDEQIEAEVRARFDRHVCVICETPLPKLPPAELKALGWASVVPRNWLNEDHMRSPRLLCPPCNRFHRGTT